MANSDRIAVNFGRIAATSARIAATCVEDRRDWKN